MEEYVKISRENYDELREQIRECEERYNDVISELENDKKTIFLYYGMTSNTIYTNDDAVMKIAKVNEQLLNRIDDLESQLFDYKNRKWYKFW